MNDQLPNSDISELHRLRRELLEEQDRVQRLSAQLSTNVSHLLSNEIGQLKSGSGHQYHYSVHVATK